MNKIFAAVLLLLWTTAVGYAGGLAVQVIQLPGGETALGERIAWAEKKAGEMDSRRYYVVWSIQKRMAERNSITIDCQGIGSVRVDELLEGKSGSEPDRSPAQLARELLEERKGKEVRRLIPVELAFFLEMERDGSGPARLMDIQAASFNSRITLENVPVFWLTRVEEEESLARFDRLYDECPDLKKDVVTAFGLHSRADLVVPLLKKGLAREEAKEVRKAAVFWLSQQAAEKACSALEEIVYASEEEMSIRERAVFALSQHQRGVDSLIRLAKGNSPAQLRKKAIFWLGQCDDERALSTILEILEN